MRWCTTLQVAEGSDATASCNCFGMLGNVVVVGVQNDEQAVAVGVVIISARLGQAVVGRIGIIKMIGIIRIQGIMVSDRGCNCTVIGDEPLGSQISRILLFLRLTGLVHLVARGNHEVHDQQSAAHSRLQRAVPCQIRRSLAAVFAAPVVIPPVRRHRSAAGPWRLRSAGHPRTGSLPCPGFAVLYSTASVCSPFFSTV